MPRLTPGQRLDLCASVALAAYAVAVTMAPALAPLAAEFATPAAAGAAAAAAFARFSMSIRTTKAIAA